MATIDCRWIAFALLVCALAETPTAAQGHYEPSNVTVDVGAGCLFVKFKSPKASDGKTGTPVLQYEIEATPGPVSVWTT